MRIVEIGLTFTDYPSPYDWAVIVYVSGCINNCPNCQNKELQNPDVGGEEIKSVEHLYDTIKRSCELNETNCVVFSGGDPLFSSNRNLIKKFLDKYSNEFNVCIYTGYSIEFVKTFELKGYKYIKCGKYDESLKQDSYKTEDAIQLASSNQNFYSDNYERISENGNLKFNLKSE